MLRLKPVYCALGSLSCWSAASKQWQPDNNGRTGAAHKQAIEWRILSNHQKCVRAYDLQGYPQWSQELCTDLVYFVSSNWYHGLWDFEQEKRPMMKMCAWNTCMWSCISWEAISYSRCVSLWMLTGLRVAFLDKVIEEFKASWSWWVTAHPKSSQVCCSKTWHAICSYLLVFKEHHRCVNFCLFFIQSLTHLGSFMINE